MTADNVVNLKDYVYKDECAQWSCECGSLAFEATIHNKNPEQIMLTCCDCKFFYYADDIFKKYHESLATESPE